MLTIVRKVKEDIKYRLALKEEQVSVGMPGRLSRFATTPSVELCAIYNSSNPYKNISKAIMESQSYLALRRKTQVHMDTALRKIARGHQDFNRRMHTLVVLEDALALAKSLGLNEDLTEAIALGHDCGHTPGGHEGERVLRANLKTDGEEYTFKHADQAVVNLEEIEGIHLPREMKAAMKNHGEDEFVDKALKNKRIFVEKSPQLDKRDGDGFWATPKGTVLEGILVQIADNTSSTFHDIKDLIHSGVLTKEIALRHPKFSSVLEGLGGSVESLFKDTNATIAKMRKNVLDHVIENAQIIDGKPLITLGKMTQDFYELRAINYDFFQYAIQMNYQDNVIGEQFKAVCEYYRKNPDKLDEIFLRVIASKRYVHSNVPVRKVISGVEIGRKAESHLKDEQIRTRCVEFIKRSPFGKKIATFISMSDDTRMNNLAQNIKPDLLNRRNLLYTMQAFNRNVVKRTANISIPPR